MVCQHTGVQFSFCRGTLTQFWNLSYTCSRRLSWTAIQTYLPSGMNSKAGVLGRICINVLGILHWFQVKTSYSSDLMQNRQDMRHRLEVRSATVEGGGRHRTAACTRGQGSNYARLDNGRRRLRQHRLHPSMSRKQSHSLHCTARGNNSFSESVYSPGIPQD